MSDERERLVESHLDLVRALATRIAARLPSHVEIEDLVHDGVLGLLDAADRYDPMRNARFLAYAEPRVRGAILDGLRRRDWRPRSVRRDQRILEETRARLSQGRGRAVTTEDIAAAMGLDLETYRALLADLGAGKLVSLEDLAPESDPVVGSEALLPHRRLERLDFERALAQEIANLPEKERRVLDLYYRAGLKMKEVGARLGVTESRVCQIHARAASRLRRALIARLHAAAARPRRTRVAER